MKSRFSLVSLGELVSKVSTWNQNNSKSDVLVNYIDISSISQQSKEINDITIIPAHQAPTRARQIIKSEDILVSTVRPNLNTVAIVPSGFDGYIASTGFCVLRPIRNRLFPKYLYYWVKTSYFVDSMVMHATGASYPAISDRIIKESCIPLPPLPEQKRIAAILDKADAIRRKRKQAIKLADDFLRTTFLDMFGDPVTNPKGWEIRRMDKLALIQSGITKGRKISDELLINVPYMRVANVQDGYINLAEIKEIEATSFEIERYSLLPGDILLTEGGDPDKLGRGAVWRGEINPCIHQNHIFKVRPNPAYSLPDYLSALIGSSRGKQYFLAAAKQTTGIASINKTQLSSFPVLLPPLDLQQRFARITQNQNALRQKLQLIYSQQNDSFNSLAQRAFRGEL